MSFHLVCVVPLHGYKKGQVVTEPLEISRLSTTHEGHFVRVDETVFAQPEPPAPVAAAKKAKEG